MTGVETTRLLDGDLVNFNVAWMSGAAPRGRRDRLCRCAAAQYALIRGYGFARHVRTNVYEEGGFGVGCGLHHLAGAPAGLQTIDAEVTVADCAEQGIPTV
jgi:hypothetical protein